MITRTRILTTECLDPHVNLAVEDALLQRVSPGEATLFLWQNQHTVVIGAGQNAWRECNAALLQSEGGALARRSSGGGAVYHDLGNLNFSFLLPREDYDVARQLSVVLRAVRSLGVDAQATGRNDIAAGGRKFSGNAFRLLKDGALHHGTLLIDADMHLVGRYLRVDAEKLQAKGVKSVPSRVINLRELADVSVASARQAMAEAFTKEYGPGPSAPVEAADLPGLDKLIKKYQSWAWNYGQSPAGALTMMKRFAWGRLEINARVEKGLLAGVLAFTDAMDETLHLRLQAALEGCPYDGALMAERAARLGLGDVAAWLRRGE